MFFFFSFTNKRENYNIYSCYSINHLSEEQQYILERSDNCRYLSLFSPNGNIALMDLSTNRLKMLKYPYHSMLRQLNIDRLSNEEKYLDTLTLIFKKTLTAPNSIYFNQDILYLSLNINYSYFKSRADSAIELASQEVLTIYNPSNEETKLLSLEEKTPDKRHRATKFIGMLNDSTFIFKLRFFYSYYSGIDSTECIHPIGIYHLKDDKLYFSSYLNICISKLFFTTKSYDISNNYIFRSNDSIAVIANTLAPIFYIYNKLDDRFTEINLLDKIPSAFKSTFFAYDFSVSKDQIHYAYKTYDFDISKRNIQVLYRDTTTFQVISVGFDGNISSSIELKEGSFVNKIPYHLFIKNGIIYSPINRKGLLCIDTFRVSRFLSR